MPYFAEGPKKRHSAPRGGVLVCDEVGLIITNRITVKNRVQKIEGCICWACFTL